MSTKIFRKSLDGKRRCKSGGGNLVDSSEDPKPSPANGRRALDGKRKIARGKRDGG